MLSAEFTVLGLKCITAESQVSDSKAVTGQERGEGRIQVECVIKEGGSVTRTTESHGPGGMKIGAGGPRSRERAIDQKYEGKPDMPHSSENLHPFAMSVKAR